MPKSTTFFFPDINFWLAYVYDGHAHHVLVDDWYSELGDESRLYFCRLSQLGLLRLLTTEAVMAKAVCTQLGAWRAYDECLEDDRCLFLDEPTKLDLRFREISQSEQAAPKEWTDAYLTAFAEELGLCLVTLDRALHARAKGSLLLI